MPASVAISKMEHRDWIVSFDGDISLRMMLLDYMQHVVSMLILSITEARGIVTGVLSQCLRGGRQSLKTGERAITPRLSAPEQSRC